MLTPRVALGIALIWLTGGFFLMNYVVTSARNVSRQYFQELGLELSGHITQVDIAPGEHDRGVLHLHVFAATPAQLAPRGRESFQYCVLQRDHADLLEGGLSEVAVGDSVQVSCARDSIYYYRRGQLTHAKRLFVYTTIPTSIMRFLDVP